jgi:hypothetical protein
MDKQVTLLTRYKKAPGEPWPNLSTGGSLEYQKDRAIEHHQRFPSHTVEVISRLTVTTDHVVHRDGKDLARAERA